MKHIYIILSLILSCGIYAQEKELDLQKLADLTNSDEDFNQYFEELGWLRSTDSLNIYFETAESEKTKVYAIKNIGNPNLFILTDKKKVLTRWGKQIEKFAKFLSSDYSPEQQIHQYKYNEAIYGWLSEKDVQTGLYSIFVMKVEEVEQKPTNAAQPKGGIESFRRNFLRRFRMNEKIKTFRGEVVFTISAKGEVVDVKTLPHNLSMEKEVKRIISDVEWLPGVDEQGRFIQSEFVWPLIIQHTE